MVTELLGADNLSKAIRALKDGEVVAFPTETVYGLGADATNSRACQKIYEAKGRPSDNPLIVHVLDIRGLESVVAGAMPKTARVLAEKFWPGPLTVIVASNDTIPLLVRGSMPTVALRAPSHPVARELIEGVGRPLAAPSANLSGRPSPTRAIDVWQDLQGRIPYIIDGGDSPVGLESTIVDCSVEPPVLLRPGFIGRETLESALGERVLLPEAGTPHKAPGMKYRHYAPRAPVIWINMREDHHIEKALFQLKKEFPNMALMAPRKWQRMVPESFLALGDTAEDVAHGLFTGFRELDDGNPDAIVVIWEENDHGVGLAVANRLGKAAARFVKQEGTARQVRK
ncbi:MAG: L-threonylcarbamoyladenylate synthase [Firmicutes bacterium]|uniref:Threonylcarbamoyl-AMP synthase n=1 Tax=Sulfobacillus benefaciens TaxID=453960 RepID=A0A2T2WSN1_9FIRM|nr:L-threonylcarbamoyladenylate synthase [Bacillota bacterium]MCL5015494.1 L-threonylcarbamoyladenylate synthase [Bacillota bacterium]PSR25249.1 MAG: threonylcarbamoyl-AMP synthase [Sulfobacillus benefaciens]